MLFPKLKVAVKIILILQAICMLMGTYTHAAWVFRHGFLYPDPDISIYSRVFWDSLTFLDPLAALLLFPRPRAGVLLVLAIICVDVLHNAVIGDTLSSFGQPGMLQWAADNRNFLLQLLFCLFVLSTLRVNLREIKKKSHR